MISRRRFVTAGSAAIVAAASPVSGVQAGAMPRSGFRSNRFPDSLPEPYHEDDARVLLARALDAAKRAGATYADARLTYCAREGYVSMGNMFPWPSTSYVAAIGVRALVNGYWGYASNPTASLENADRLGTEATNAAKVGALGKMRPIDLGTIPVVRNGQWQTPIEIDPFAIPYGEKIDGVRMLGDFIARQRPGVEARLSVECFRDQRTFASSEGSYYTQTLYRVGGKIEVAFEQHWRSQRSSLRMAPFYSPRGGGWEQVLRLPLRERLPQLLDEADRMRIVKPVDIGRYDVVFDAQATALLLNATVGPATDLYRAMGFDANGHGSSFLTEPETMVGTFTLGTPQLTITANRSMENGAATVKWDDEGVEPDTFTLIDKGVLNDFQTTRESAAWLAPYYQRRNQSVRSHGCTGTDSAVDITGPAIPNLVMDPGTQNISFADLVAQTERGYAVLGGFAETDHQCLNGWGMGNVTFEIRNGKIGTAILGASYLFRTPELLKSITAMGGEASAESHGMEGGKSWNQRSFRTIRSVPVKVSNIGMANLQRKVV